ncbi:hypothetical protein TNCT_76111 [Trichonephila clavata]|uniref:RNase H type-1 domain-containing protein n=1 Tax=Trichonephila clavata TaxID=2740835 RepID=A0A8X6LGQ3_TRICU|nr:hypothetical protein TNCT_76111 [Trichonephila clavata]
MGPRRRSRSSAPAVNRVPLDHARRRPHAEVGRSFTDRATMQTVSNAGIETVFISEQIAIKKGLNYLDNLAEPDFKSILTDSRFSSHHLSNWKVVGERVGISILRLIDKFMCKLFIPYSMDFVPCGIIRNEIAGSLAKAATLDISRLDLPSTFSERERCSFDNKKKRRNI